MTHSEAWNYINSLEHAPAKLKGRVRSIDSIDMIVIHRLATHAAAGGVRYVQELGDGRFVSWHATTCAQTGYTYRHLPVTRTGAHCKYPIGTNARSLGVEIGGPMGSEISPAAHAAVRKLCEAWCTVAPISRIISHEAADAQGPRKNRTDPGPEFDMMSLTGIVNASGPVRVTWWDRFGRHLVSIVKEDA